MDLAFRVRTKLPVDSAVRAVEQALAEHKFAVLWELDVNAKLAEKGQVLQIPYRILEVCNAPLAREALEINPEVGYFLPCKVVVYGQGEETVVGLVRPQALIGLLEDTRMRALATDVEEHLIEALRSLS